jgi:hypothetical protein
MKRRKDIRNGPHVQSAILRIPLKRMAIAFLYGLKRHLLVGENGIKTGLKPSRRRRSHNDYMAGSHNNNNSQTSTIPH